jgi:drug/metabolite transporter (DMT)-like permease
MGEKVSLPLLIFVLIIGTLSISSGAIFVRLIDDVPSLVIATYRMVFSAVITVFIWKIKGAPISAVTKREFNLCILSGFFLAFHFATWIDSLQYTSIANSVMLVNMNPIFIGIFAYILFREKQSPALVFSIFAAIVGCFFLTVYDSNFTGFSGGSDAMTGNLLALAGALGTSFYMLIGSRVMGSMNILTYILLVYASSAGFLALFTFFMGYSFTGYATSSYVYLILMALFPQFMGHSAFNWALKYMKSSIVAVVKLGEPIGAAILAYFIFAEGVTFGQAFGMFVIFAAILLALRKREV